MFRGKNINHLVNHVQVISLKVHICFQNSWRKAQANDCIKWRNFEL